MLGYWRISLHTTPVRFWFVVLGPSEDPSVIALCCGCSVRPHDGVCGLAVAHLGLTRGPPLDGPFDGPSILLLPRRGIRERTSSVADRNPVAVCEPNNPASNAVPSTVARRAYGHERRHHLRRAQIGGR